MQEREEAVRRWFSMWLHQTDTGICGLFTEDCEYIESWGPRYVGSREIAHWFQEWNNRGRVIRWDIQDFLHCGSQTAVTWHFEDRMADGASENFDGVSLIRWTDENTICFLKEYGCRLPHYDPYRGHK